MKCQLSADYLFNEFKKMGLDVDFHDWEYDEYKCRNVVATLEGTDPDSNAEFIVSAHYDTVRKSPGANDDGSGVASVLAVANACSKYSFNHTIRFICFSGEEIGTYGSFSYVLDAYKNEDNIVGVLNLDGVGYADTSYGGRIIRVLHEERSDWIAEYIVNLSDKHRDLIDIQIEDMPNYRGNDAQPFSDWGYDAVWFGGHDSYRWGHKPEDNLSHINFTYLTKVAKFTLIVLAELSLKPIDLQIIIKKPYEGSLYFNDRSIPLSFGRRFFSRIRGVTIIFGRPKVVAEVFSSQEIKYVVFFVDNNFVSWDSTPPYEWDFANRLYWLFGRYKLKVYAYTTTGMFASDEMDIIVFQDF
jgi:hypothetical protein